ncbi:MAG: hypothetical protein Q4D55_01920 [Eubacteriales bacterium]|nr:hypothetical protein [Eubacteriales bacterium]
MKKNIFAVCDLEVEYALNFMDHLNQRRSIPFEIQAFTTVDSLVSFGKKTPIELLLISGKAMCSQIRELEIGKIVILSEGLHPPELEQYPSVYKYQSSAAVIREVMACYGEEKTQEPEDFPVLKKATEIYGVYSPLGRCLKTSFALTLGQALARDRAVLYLNLEEYAGFDALLGKTFRHNLSDLLYYVRQEGQGLIHRMNGMTETMNNLDYIPPVQTPADIRGALWQDWERLIQEIVVHSSYEVLVLDIGNGIDEVFSMLEMCGRIYMPVLGDAVSLAKISQFENLLKLGEFSQVLERTVQVKPPYHVARDPGQPYVEGLLWSELGDYVRELLRKERHEP